LEKHVIFINLILDINLGPCFSSSLHLMSFLVEVHWRHLGPKHLILAGKIHGIALGDLDSANYIESYGTIHLETL